MGIITAPEYQHKKSKALVRPANTPPETAAIIVHMDDFLLGGTMDQAIQANHILEQNARYVHATLKEAKPEDQGTRILFWNLWIDFAAKTIQVPEERLAEVAQAIPAMRTLKDVWHICIRKALPLGMSC